VLVILSPRLSQEKHENPYRPSGEGGGGGTCRDLKHEPSESEGVPSSQPEARNYITEAKLLCSGIRHRPSL
jgi:hypothetical protein